MKGSLEYFIREGFPGSRAHHIQIARQAAAFAAEGLATALVVPRLPKESPSEIQARFGLERPLDIRAISTAARLPRIARDVFYKRALVKHVRGASDVTFYGRSSGKLPMPVVLRERGKTAAFIEVHSGDFDDGWDKLLPGATGLIAISGGLRDALVRLGIPREKILVAHDGVSLQAYDRRAELPKKGPWIVFTGHLYPDRGADVLLEAASRLPDARCVFVGGTPEDIERHQALARKHRMADRAEFTGLKTPAEVPAYQMAADVLVMPYRSNLSTREWCSPLKLFEYMAAGAPIVSSDLPSIREVLRHEENALLVPADDAKALAAAIARLLKDRSLSRSLARRAREDVEAYTWSRRARSIIEFMKGRAR